MNNKLFFAPPDKSSGGQGRYVPNAFYRKSGVKDVLPDADDTVTHGKEKRNGGRSEIKLSPETEAIYQLGRMLCDDYPSLSAYVADVMRQFKGATRCTIYRGADALIGGQKKRILGHYLTVVQAGGVFKTRAVDEDFSIMDGRSRALIAFREAKPTVLDFKPRLRMVFRNLDRHDKSYETFRLRPDVKEGMKAYIPFMYRKGAPMGIVVFEGDLGLSGCDHSGEEKMSFAAVAGTFAGSQIAFQLVHKFDATTRLKRKEDFNIDMEEAVKKLQKGRVGSVFVLLIDIDNFKGVNDNHGYLKGDELLSKVAERISASVRVGSDGHQAPEGAFREPDNVSRFGGEEFVVILQNVTAEGAIACAKRIISGVSSLSIPAAQQGKFIRVTCSIGAVDVARYLRERGFRTPRRASRDVFNECNALLKRAKETGKDRLYVTEMRGGKLVAVEYKNGHSAPGQAEAGE